MKQDYQDYLNDLFIPDRENPMKCDICNSEKDVSGAIIDGKYQKVCIGCQAAQERKQTAGAAEYERERQREDHRRDMLQPFENGRPNKEFIAEYPEESKNFFNDKQIEEYQ